MAKSTLDRLTSLGEEVIGKAAHNPTAARVLQGAMQLKDRVDDLSKRVRGLEGSAKRATSSAKKTTPAKPSPKK